ncbi:D-alanyl-D-alanine carboxypeptidase [Streptomyces regalis]|uniref:D-alanyl-D-alanine carboxypeptidase n=1 Tax=Streptomyces regalis TaxID=68262 RepID=UPI001FC97650|nr:D-alanyl-D-alanine carboxypeptidase [Streptomyces regalis]
MRAPRAARLGALTLRPTTPRARGPRPTTPPTPTRTRTRKARTPGARRPKSPTPRTRKPRPRTPKTPTPAAPRPKPTTPRTRKPTEADNAEDAQAETEDAEDSNAGSAEAEADNAEGAQAKTEDAEDSNAGSAEAEADNAEDAQAKTEDAEDSNAGSAEAEVANAEDSAAEGRDTEADNAEDAQAETGNAAGANAENSDTASTQAETYNAEGSAAEGPDAEAKDTQAKADNAEDSAGEGSQGAEGKAAAPGDNRLRVAVAAWVASEDTTEEGTKDADARDEADGAGDGAVAGSASKAETAASRTDKPTDAEDDAPAAADGEDAPQGPPAPDDESRTGGAGGNTGAEGEAEAGQDAAAPPAKPVDQPTAVFKAVRPAKPPVDQPTTTLKAPRQPEAPAERTSKFVALKPDIRQDTPKAPNPRKAPADVTAAVPQVGPERTTQQPLPPKPPLDLLAELTNTPRPPDTPVRTIIRRVKIWTPLVLLLVIILGVVQSVRPLPAPTLDLTAEDTYTFDGSKVDIPWPAEGQAALDVDGLGTFGSSGDQKPVPIASVAKVMTAYLILREHPLESGAEGPDIEIDQAAEDQSDAGQESTVDVTAGDKITQREALESVLIASANNIARRLARWDAGSEKAFVTKMNATAKELGMTNTTYTDPSGLNNTTVSTAVDQVKLAKAAMKEPAFREVAAMMSYDDYKGRNHGNWNQLVGKNNVVGIKTGTTTSALGNLVFAAKKEVGGETRTIIGAVVRQPDAGGGILAAALDSGDQLIRAAQDALKSATLLKKGDVVGYVDDGLGGRTPVVATKDVTAVGWPGLKVELTFASDAVPNTAKAGTKVGTLTVGDGTSGAVKIPVALQTELTEPGFTDKLTRIA